MAHARHVKASWATSIDDEDDGNDLERSFALAEDDADPLRLKEAAEDGSPFDAAAFDDSDDDDSLPADFTEPPSKRRADQPARTRPERMAAGGDEDDDGSDGELDWGGTIRASIVVGRPGTALKPSSSTDFTAMRTFTTAHDARSFAASENLRRPDAEPCVVDGRRPSVGSPEGQDDDDDDLVLPSALSRLSLQPLRPRPSALSFVFSPDPAGEAVDDDDDWPAVARAPPSSTCSNAPSLVRDGTGSEAEPSSSDIDFDLLEPDDDSSGRARGRDRDDDDDGEDGLAGLILPDPLLFARANASAYLRSLLEAKSKGSAPSGDDGRSATDTVRIASGLDSSFARSASDDAFEADLVLDDDNNEDDGDEGGGRKASRLLSTARLKTVKARSLTAAARARTLPALPPGGPRPKPVALTRSGSLAATASSARTKSTNDEEWTRELERGWRRPKSPLPPPALAPQPMSSVASLGKGRPSTQARSMAPVLVPQVDAHASGSAAATTTTPLRRQRSQARLDESSLPFSTASNDNSPALVQPVQQARFYPGSYAQGLLARKSSLPLLSLGGSSAPANDDVRAGSPSGSGFASQHQRRFAAPTASSLARIRERPSPGGERGSIINPDIFAPPSSTTPAGSRSATPQLTFSPSSALGLTSLGPGSRLTMPTSSTRLKLRPAVSHAAFGSTSSTSSSALSFTPPAPVRPLVRPQILRTIPRSVRKYSDGTELDALEDLAVDVEKERLFHVPAKKSSGSRLADLKSGYGSSISSASLPIAPRVRVNSTLTASTASTELKRKKSPVTGPVTAEGGTQRSTRRGPPPTLKVIRNLGGADKARVEGKMRYNPATFRWEGNEAILQAFEPTPPPARPALITQLTSTSIPSLAGAVDRQPGSPIAIASPAIGARVVGHMQFDPVRMCWVSLLAKDEEEPDPFAGMDDDDDADDDQSAVVAGYSRPSRSRRDPSCPGRFDDSDDLELKPAAGAALPPVNLAEFIRRGPAEYDLARRSRHAEEGHRADVAQWALGTALSAHGGARSGGEKDCGHLWEIRKVALRAGKNELGPKPATAVKAGPSGSFTRIS